MITIRSERERFLFRVAGIIFNQDGSKVLIHKTKWEDSWILPGGRVEMGENTNEAILRELKEELGIKEKVKLKYIAESFFEHNNINHHELGFFYEVIIDPNKYDLDKEGEFLGLEGGNQIFKWVLINDLKNYPLIPKKLNDIIINKEKSYRHIIIDEIK